MTLERVLGRMMAIYSKALEDKTIKKPISYTLYHTWEWTNTYERERKTRRRTNERNRT